MGETQSGILQGVSKFIIVLVIVRMRGGEVLYFKQKHIQEIYNLGKIKEIFLLTQFCYLHRKNITFNHKDIY